MLLKSSSGSRSSHGPAAISSRSGTPSAPLETASLSDLMDQHIAALRATADVIHASCEARVASDVTNVAFANTLLGVGRKEEAGRAAIVNYAPQGDGEANMKLTYLAAYLIATGSTLTAHEMSSILEARDRVAASLS